MFLELKFIYWGSFIAFDIHNFRLKKFTEKMEANNYDFNSKFLKLKMQNLFSKYLKKGPGALPKIAFFLTQI